MPHYRGIGQDRFEEMRGDDDVAMAKGVGGRPRNMRGLAPAAGVTVLLACLRRYLELGRAEFFDW